MSRTGRDAPWTEAELDVVRRYYRTEPVAAVAARLPGRTVDAVRHAAKRVGVKSARTWTPEDDAALRAGWGVERTADLSRRLGRGPTALKQRAVRLGLAADRHYTPADLETVRSMYATRTAAEIATAVHGTPRAAKSVYRMAARLGLRKIAQWSPEEVERVRGALAEGGTDAAVAARLGLTREQVTHVRNRLGLPRDEGAVRAARRRAVRTQFARLGVRSGGELRALGYRRYAAENGWPEDLPPRAVQILNVLAERGPQTKRELAAAIGMATGQTGCNGSPMFLKASARSATMHGHASYTALLAARGLVLRQRRSAGPGSGVRGGKLPDLYSLSPAAITWRDEHVGRERARERGAERPGDRADEAGVRGPAAE